MSSSTRSASARSWSVARALMKPEASRAVCSPASVQRHRTSAVNPGCCSGSPPVMVTPPPAAVTKPWPSRIRRPGTDRHAWLCGCAVRHRGSRPIPAGSAPYRLLGRGWQLVGPSWARPAEARHTTGAARQGLASTYASHETGSIDTNSSAVALSFSATVRRVQGGARDERGERPGGHGRDETASGPVRRGGDRSGVDDRSGDLRGPRPGGRRRRFRAAARAGPGLRRGLLQRDVLSSSRRPLPPVRRHLRLRP